MQEKDFIFYFNEDHITERGDGEDLTVIEIGFPGWCRLPGGDVTLI